MTSILISSDDRQVCEYISHQLAEHDGYEHIGRSLLKSIAEKHDVSEEKLQWALNGTGGRKLSKKEQDLLLSYIQAATLEGLAHDSVVCTDLAAHLYVRNVSHVLQLRVLARPETRLEEFAAQNKLSPRKAKKALEKTRASRVRWSTESFGVSEYDPAIYDIVVQIQQIDADKVLQIIRDTAGFRGFQPMTYSRNCLQDLLLASKVRVALLPKYSEIRVRADGDRLIVHVKCSKRQKPQTVSGIKGLAGKVEDVGLVEVHAASNLRDADVDTEAGPFLKDE